MNSFKFSINKLRTFLKEDKLKNNLVEDEIMNVNFQRILYSGCLAIIVHILHVLLFQYNFTPATDIELIWQKGIITIHGINVIIMLLIVVSGFILNKKGISKFIKKLIETIFTVDILAVGIALVTVDQYVTTNITPFLVICTIMGVLILKRPVSAVGIYLSIYLVFYKTIGFYQAKSTILMTNRVNGITFVSIGICISIVIWYSYRTNILQNIKIKEQQIKLEKLAYYDTLTGLYNRRKLMSILNDEIKRMNIYGYEGSIILSDIDYFKKINDKFGHPAGDKVLQEVAAILKKELQVDNKAARWGGEEFIIFLPETSISAAIGVAEKLREIIENKSIETEGSTLNITVSFGVTSFNSKEGFAKSYSRADEALYLAKQKGRNRVECIDI